MTFEDFLGWKDAYEQDPWGERRADERAIANTLFAVIPHLLEYDGEVPNPAKYPYFGLGEQETAESIARLKARKKELLERGNLNRKTRDPADG